MSNSWTSLNINTNQLDQSIISSYFEQYSLGNQYLDQEVIMYFLLKHKKVVNDIVLKLDKKYNIDYNWKIIKSENWMTNWKKYFKPVSIDEKVVIIPDWDQNEYKNPLVVKIFPAMAFGTGHHQSTQLMIRQMIKYDIGKYKKILDVGCGSGVLSITAKLMGSRIVDAIDNDLICRENFKKNCNLNKIKDINFSIEDVGDYSNYNYDVILANIDRNNILKILKSYQESNSSAILIVAGLLDIDSSFIQDALNGYCSESLMQMDEWISLVIRKEADL
ncbi:MAG: hypothetical protein CMG00_06485 [Candidatus Marinimicrobia bacterium]|nr:hypothetical protein [Candidatus Neomarinimicrobiota bacterium]|tara:strand:- start:1052 stop:1879 length:828 start_codon:yes stop_codon:yes gene_type:complete